MSTGCLKCLALEERIATLQVALSSLMAMHDNSAAASRLERVVERFERLVVKDWGREAELASSLANMWSRAEEVETFIEGKRK